ncbi:inositol polyphosphate phosphatase [Coniophora puteana RWD-64-598 SS2]|uniref:Inositol polyphosphate phosphatase n=1 Tax=Coniophora puteana (strain RWD-64-598) TaxID=741705 RepID=A0A5M3N108_CONPW|nr:inositol polyphosphate phosphatase [Coniophora puteana RWD-64-598 SS2]EIW85093.1 inositol polyphosphate phosphatase [Coniophora puteana RWD-64-598 SS2]
MTIPTADDGRLLVQIGSYNTNLQGGAGLPQNLVDWLAPTLQVSSFLARGTHAPDIVAIGFQELLPLHLGLSGLSKSIISERDKHIRSQIEAHAPGKEQYSLVARIVNVGVALLVYARDSGAARSITDVQTQWTGCGPGFMGNKGAVGIRFRASRSGDDPGEVFTFVCAHLNAHEYNLDRRIADWNHIVASLLFPPLPGSAESAGPTTLYTTSHLFFLGDLNFRVVVPPDQRAPGESQPAYTLRMLDDEPDRERLKEYDQLLNARRAGRVFVGLREGAFWTFKCTYKYKLGEVEKYSDKRTASWTDRVLYATYLDSPDTPEKSAITNVLYTSIPSYTTSDHKPIVCLLLLPPPVAAESSAINATVPTLKLPTEYSPCPDPHAALKRYTGRTLDRIIGFAWWALTLIGVGNAAVGVFNFMLGLAAWKWWPRAPVSAVSA